MIIKPRFSRFYILSALLFLSQVSFAQSGPSGSTLLIITLVGVGIFLLFGAIFTISDNLLQIEAKKSGIDTEKKNFSIFPRWTEIFGRSNPVYTGDDYVHDLKKGYNIKLVGSASREIESSIPVSTFAMRPQNFRNLSPIPRVTVQQGDDVKAGDVLFHDKQDTRIKYVTPVSGEVIEIRRGQKRSITDIIILADKKIEYKKFKIPGSDALSCSQAVELMMESGIWSLLNQRPYDLVPDPEIIPANIFISSFDTAPLSPDHSVIIDGKSEEFQKGLDVLSSLTSGKVHLSLNANAVEAPHDIFRNAKSVVKHWFKGPHPAGNVGVQIHHIDPIKSNEKVWTIGVQEVVTVGEFFLKGIYNAERVFAITGAEVTKPKYIRSYIGANVYDLLKNKLSNENVRIVAGDVLTGKPVGEQDFMNVHDDQITVLREGDYYELFGWLLALTPRPSVSRTFPNFLFPGHEYEADTNMHGEKRAFVMTGQYESVLPMDIYPQHLMKAIMTGDFEKMEGLGINELSEEDIALCEFACTSKMPLQDILRQGLEMMREQG